jgi:hypothetical protein
MKTCLALVVVILLVIPAFIVCFVRSSVGRWSVDALWLGVSIDLVAVVVLCVIGIKIAIDEEQGGGR